MPTNRRLEILAEKEISMLYERPHFTEPERRHFFVLPDAVFAALNIKLKNGKSVSSILYFILQYGFFKAKHLFFNFQYSEIKDDVRFVMNNYMPKDIVPKKLPTRKSMSVAQTNILKLFGMKNDVKMADAIIFEKANSTLKKPAIKLIFFMTSFQH